MDPLDALAQQRCARPPGHHRDQARHRLPGLLGRAAPPASEHADRLLRFAAAAATTWRPCAAPCRCGAAITPIEAIGHQCMTYGISLWLPVSRHRHRGRPQRALLRQRHHAGRALRLLEQRQPQPRLRHRHARAGARLRRACAGSSASGGRSARTTTATSTRSRPGPATTQAWMAWQFDRPEPGEGMVQVFRRHNSFYESARLKLRGLEPKARYAVVNLDAPAARQEVTGSELMDKGLRVEIPASPAAAVMRYRKLNWNRCKYRTPASLTCSSFRSSACQRSRSSPLLAPLTPWPDRVPSNQERLSFPTVCPASMRPWHGKPVPRCKPRATPPSSSTQLS